MARDLMILARTAEKARVRKSLVVPQVRDVMGLPPKPIINPFTMGMVLLVVPGALRLVISMMLIRISIMGNQVRPLDTRATVISLMMLTFTVRPVVIRLTTKLRI